MLHWFQIDFNWPILGHFGVMLSPVWSGDSVFGGYIHPFDSQYMVSSSGKGLLQFPQKSMKWGLHPESLHRSIPLSTIHPSIIPSLPTSATTLTSALPPPPPSSHEKSSSSIWGISPISQRPFFGSNGEGSSNLPESLSPLSQLRQDTERQCDYRQTLMNGATWRACRGREDERKGGGGGGWNNPMSYE